MSVETEALPRPEIVYPDSDGQPMAENTLQFEWITMLKGNLEVLFRDDPEVFVAGDLLWYPVEGDPTVRCAPDAMVVFGRPKGYRGSYRQWDEDGIAPQVVFEVLSPGNTVPEMIRKQRFYEAHGVEECYYLDPERGDANGWRREGGHLANLADLNGWVSPRLGIRFLVGTGGLALFGSDGQPFRTWAELARERDEQRQRAERLAARLRELGVDPDA